MKQSSANSSNGSLKFLLGYLFLSFFAALAFSLLVVRARKTGKIGIGWFILSLICMGTFGLLGSAFVQTSSPTHDAGYYYLGWSTLVANGLAGLILILSFLIKRNGIDS